MRSWCALARERRSWHQFPVPRYGNIRPQYRTANQLKSEHAPTTFIARGMSASGSIDNAGRASRVSNNDALAAAMPMNATFDHHTALLKYRWGCMVRNSNPVTALIRNPPIAHGIIALMCRTGTPRNMPINRKSSNPAPPISMHRPMKCSDSHSGHSHDTANNDFEIQVDSSQVANSSIGANQAAAFRYAIRRPATI